MCQLLKSDAYCSAVSMLQPSLAQSATKVCLRGLCGMKASGSSPTRGRIKQARALVAVKCIHRFSDVLIFPWEPSA